jgi:hypothetical protein
MQFIKKHYFLLFNALCLIVNCLICPCKSNGYFDTPPSETIYRVGRSVADEMVAQPTIYFSVVSGRGELCAGSSAREEGSSGANVDFWKETCNAYATQQNIIKWGPCSISPMPLEALIYQQSHPQKVKSEGR